MTEDQTADDSPAPAADPGLVPEDLLASEVTLVTPTAGGEAVATAPEPDPAAISLPSPGVEPDREAVKAVRALADRLECRLDELQTLFDREIRAEATREKVVDRLHAELQEYKHDLLLSTLRPVFLDLIQLHDDIGKVIGATEGAESDAPDGVSRLLGLMAGFQQGIEDILYRQGVEPFQVEGDAFDPRRQRAVATVATEDPAASKTLAARHRQGFRSGDRVIRPEVVSVYSLKK
jgi:molecular chaperone GrpE